MEYDIGSLVTTDKVRVRYYNNRANANYYVRIHDFQIQEDIYAEGKETTMLGNINFIKKLEKKILLTVGTAKRIR